MHQLHPVADSCRLFQDLKLSTGDFFILDVENGIMWLLGIKDHLKPRILQFEFQGYAHIVGRTRHIQPGLYGAGHEYRVNGL